MASVLDKDAWELCAAVRALLSYVDPYEMQMQEHIERRVVDSLVQVEADLASP